ncbi:TlpA family protein disulfide reductase [Echinicola sp. CAU 1574]|uniref:TlpA family protein disulfide reductase n=1 Tax=Echinicola arenosa TaxID=2774144 RepID=A0ABR9AQ98_9BACT|nr:TlpA disulfide reductase family protein [Echinicola arenosa]MBD8490521.1 TlpA family protein disulfide reductase [Echinicola arenosa]
MKKWILSLITGLLTFITAFLISDYTLGLSKDYSLWGFGALLGFVLLFVSITFYYKKFDKLLSSKAITFLSLFSVLIFIFVTSPSLRFSTKVFPSYLSYILAVLGAGIFSAKDFKRKGLYTTLLFLFPLLLNLNLYNTWVHFIEFGNISGKVTNKKTIGFEAKAIDGETVSNESLKGKIVVLDFWFISCGPCWKKFPHLQSLYEQYKDNPAVEIFALNRPMTNDKPMQAFHSIKDRGYNFPVLQGTQKIMDDFDIYVYPTVVVLNRNGSIIYMGTIEGVDEILQKELNN